MSWSQRFLLLLPVLLIGTTFLVFVAMDNLLGAPWGYLAGFIFYWGAWCLAVPWRLLGWEGIKGLFGPPREVSPTAVKVQNALLVMPPILFFGLFWADRYPQATFGVLALSLLLAVVNGTLEELLWRGVYSHFFPGRFVPGLFLPVAGYALWHLSPQVAQPGLETLIWDPVIVAAVLGACYGWIAYRFGTVRYTALSHIAVDFAMLGGLMYVG